MNCQMFSMIRGQWDEGDVVRHNQPVRHVPAGLIDKQRSVVPRRHADRDFGKVQLHGFDIAI
jgi:hypothetical protein